MQYLIDKMETNNSPKISVIIPYFNQEVSYLKDALFSVLAQSYNRWELILVNDGSTKENTNKIENIIEELNDKRIKLINLINNIGTSGAKNIGIENSKGEIITFLDSDDLLLPWHYQEIVDSFFTYPDNTILAFPFIYFYHNYFFKKLSMPNYAHNLKLKGILFTLDKHLKAKLFLMGSPMLAVKKETFNVISFDSSLKSAEDTDICFQILNNDNLIRKLIAKPLIGYLYRTHIDNNRLTNKPQIMFNSIEKLKEKYSCDNSLASEIVAHWDQIEDWRYSKVLSDYFNNGSISHLFKNNIFSSYPFKGKLRALKVLTKKIINYRLFTHITGTRLTELKIIFNKKNNLYREIKETFTNHLNLSCEEKSKIYAETIFKKIF